MTTAVRLPRSLHERLRAAADERQVAANLLVQKALEDYLRRLRPVADLAPLSQPDGTVER